MADYTPVYVEGECLTSTASAAVKGGDVLEVSGSGTVAPITPSATPSLKVVGIAQADCPSGGRVSIWARGPVHESVADGSVTAGDQLVTATNANRQVRSLAAVTTPTAADVVGTRAILGIALTSVADNAKVRWMDV
jgi:Uncharacterized conserved protein (DUF2190)